MNYDGNTHETERPSRRTDLYSVAMLTTIYLEVGLPLDQAVKSAIADYRLFEREPTYVCAS